MSRVHAEGERDCICARQKRVESEATELEIITSEEYGAWRTPRTAWGHWDWGMSGSAADSLAQVKRPPLSELPALPGSSPLRLRFQLARKARLPPPLVLPAGYTGCDGWSSGRQVRPGKAVEQQGHARGNRLGL